jgi:hypothetical protein
MNLGKFSIPLDIIDKAVQGISMDDSRKVLLILKGMIIVRAESLYPTSSVEYYAFSEYFEPLAQGEKVPEYTYKRVGGTCGIVYYWTREQ